MVKRYLPFLAILSLGIAAAFAQNYPVPQIRGQLDPRSTPFNAACDGATDDHVALAAWAAASRAGKVGIVNGNCMTSTPIIFPDVSGITIEGKDGQNSRLTYIGGTTTGDVFAFGGSTTVNTLNIRNIEFETATVMTAGATLHIKNVSNGSMKGVTVGSASNYGYNGLWLDNVAAFDISGFYYFNGSANDVLISGVTGSGSAGDIWFTGGGSIANGSGIGLHIAGGVNGLNFLAGDVLVNKQNLVIDESLVAASNKGLFFGPDSFVDIQTGSSAPNVELVASTATVQDYVTFKGTWFASSGAGQPCVQIDSGWQGYVNFQRGEIQNCNTYGILVNSTSAHVEIGGTYFMQMATGIGAVAGSHVFADSPVFSANVATPWSGPISSNPNIGRTDGSGSVAAGYVGEPQDASSFSGTAATSGAYLNPTGLSVTLTPGEWTCFGSAITYPNTTTTTSYFEGGFSTSPTTVRGYGDTATFRAGGVSIAGYSLQQNFGPAYFNVTSSPITAYVVAQATFGVSTMNLGGAIHCKRTQ